MINNEFDEHNPTLDDMGVGGDTSPMGGELGGPSGFAASDEPSAIKRHAGGALLLAAVVAIAIVGLFSMRTLTRATASMDAPTDVEKTIDTFMKMLETNKAGTTHKSGSQASVLDVLSESYTQRQVPLTEVQRNPFIIFDRTDAPVTTAPKEEIDPRVEWRRMRIAQFERASERLRLGSIMMGNNPLANINRQVVRVGESIMVLPDEVLFTVTAIEATSVTLVADDPEYDVKVPITLHLRNR